jgi:hypothetical protein
LTLSFSSSVVLLQEVDGLIASFSRPGFFAVVIPAAVCTVEMCTPLLDEIETRSVATGASLWMLNIWSSDCSDALMRRDVRSAFLKPV